MSSTDETAIREMVATWMAASQSGDVDTVLELVADDVVFLTPGRPPMHKADFEAMSRAQAKPGGPKIASDSDIQEIQVVGDWAFLWTRLHISVTPPDGAAIERAGRRLRRFRRRRFFLNATPQAGRPAPAGWRHGR